MSIMNLSAVKRRLTINIINTVLACIVIFLGVMCIIVYRSHIYFACFFTAMTLGVTILGYTEVSSYAKVKHDLDILRHKGYSVAYKDDCVCYGDERLLAFDTLLRVSQSGVYLDIQNKTILVPSVVKDEIRAVHRQDTHEIRPAS